MPILVIEGPDYSGKTILINDLKPVLKNAIFLWEPGSTPFADRQRELLKDFSVDPWAKQMLMHGSRYDMLAHHGWCMDAEKLYVIDRYELSTYVYGTVDGVP